jgi:hypothetical protein
MEDCSGIGAELRRQKQNEEEKETHNRFADHRGIIVDVAAGPIPGILVEPLREWRNWQTRKT